MMFQSIIPILFSSDIAQSVQYYTEVLGFKGSWIWDEPASFGGVDMGEVRIFFCRDGQGQRGTWLAINLDDVDAYYQTISGKGAKILNPPESFPWGMREMLVEDPDGHIIRFGHGISVREKSKPEMPDNIKIISGTPSADEMKKLTIAAGWSKPDEDAPSTLTVPSIARKEGPNILHEPPFAHAVIAKNKDDEEVVGCGFLFTDNTGFYYLKNVLVHPDWQGQQIGTAIVKHLDDWLQEHAPDQSTVALHTGSNLAHFYRQFGFSPAFSMQKRIIRKK